MKYIFHAKTLQSFNFNFTLLTTGFINNRQSGSENFAQHFNKIREISTKGKWYCRAKTKVESMKWKVRSIWRKQ